MESAGILNSLTINILVSNKDLRDYKDYMDAENLMPLPTSDLKNPICLEMRLLRSEMEAVGGGGPMEMGSVDSSDTFTSCNTQPFNSHMDLTTEDPTALGCDSSNLYINPLESARGVVKKSISRDSGLRNLGNSLIDEESRFPSSKRSSRGSLTEDSLPKHRRTRFQQLRSVTDPCRDSQESLDTIKRRKSSFMPAKSLASATKLINQHLFGMQNCKQAKFIERRSSVSNESLDRLCSTPESHRRSKSILKRHLEGRDGNGHRNDRGSTSDDPEMERLISDNVSGASGSDYSPARCPPCTTVNAISAATVTTVKPHTLPIKLVGIASAPGVNDQLDTVLLKDLLNSARAAQPLFICPPPPPMDPSPTEETKLLVDTSRFRSCNERSLSS